MKKKKINLHAIGNDGNFNYYIFDKKKNVYWSLVKIFRDLFKLHLETYDNKNREINIEKYKDLHKKSGIHVGNESRIDLFYGDKKMFVMIHCSSKLRIKFNKELFKIAEISKLKIK